MKKWIGFGLIILALAAIPALSRRVGYEWPGHQKPRVFHFTESKGDPTQIGQWSAPFSLGMIPIHAVLLDNGQVLLFQYASKNGTGGIIATAYDPATGIVTSLPNPSTTIDYFCSGTSQLPDGRILVAGGLDGPQGNGSKGIAESVIFDPATMNWDANPSMSNARYYPTNVQLANGDALIFSGYDAAGTQIVRPVEQYAPATASWHTLAARANLPVPRDWDSYPRMFLLTDGNIFNAGQKAETWLFDPSTKTWTYTGDFLYGDRHDESAVLMPDLHTVMVMGGQQGASAHDMVIDPQVTRFPPTNTVETIDLSQPTPTWTWGMPMNYPRHFANAIQLPDGTILVVGGVQGNLKYNDPVYAAESYNPSTATWTVDASQQGQRGYHSTAILLPNATVLSAGSDSGDSLQTYGEIYSPAYLFNGQQPTITSAPSTLSYGANFTVTTPHAANIKSVVLIKNDSVTHADHFDQRLIPLAFTAGNDQLTVTAPTNGNYAPPGYYMLFIVTGNGVPSVAPIVKMMQ